jgi:FAD/FMN-containing dehydrogenase
MECRMSEDQREEILRALERSFGDRLKRGSIRGEEPGTEDVSASVLPMNAEEVKLLAQIAARHSVPLVALGAGTAPESGIQRLGIEVRFDLMRRMRLPEGGEPWVEAEPGASWLQLDDALRVRGMGLAVYPTSAPRATVGGWLATDGLGVGSFEYGWLNENVLSVSVVMRGGERREVAGEELRSLVGPGGGSRIVVDARLRTRRADADVPFAAAFSETDDLAASVADLSGSGVPLWHLAFVNPVMARARRLGEDYLLFGAYPQERAHEVEANLRDAIELHRGRILPTAQAHRVWGERFFPVAPSHPTPRPLARELTSVEELPEALGRESSRPEHAALQGTIARSAEVLLLAIEDPEEGWAR